jgi:hypothetical protein
MKRLIAISIAIATIYVVFAERPAEADIGSCYSVRPICLAPQVPICICDIVRNCFWACR